MIGRIGNVLFFLGLSLWVGGILALGVVTAPALFGRLPQEQAADLFGTILRRFAWVELLCGTVAWLGGLLCLLGRASGTLASWGRLLFLTLMIIVSSAATFAVHPRVGELRHIPEQRARFDRLHKISVRMMQFNLLLGLALLGWAALGARRPQAAVPAP